MNIISKFFRTKKFEFFFEFRTAVQNPAIGECYTVQNLWSKSYAV